MKSIFKGKFLSHFFAFTITAILMTMCVNAEVYTTDVKLTDDSTEPIVIAENSKVTIDLNGKTLDVTGVAITVNKGAIVTIKGNGKVLATRAGVFNNGGTVTIENGTFFSSTFYAIKNLGTMTINGGLFTQEYGENKGNSSLIANGFYGNLTNDLNVVYPTTDPNVTLTINGGKFNQTSSTTQTIKGDDWSKTIINGGEFISVKGKLIQASGDVVVNDGTFTGYENVGWIYGDGSSAIPGTLTINGGSYDADYIVLVSGKGFLTITGGDFTNIEKGINNVASTKKLDYEVTGGTYLSNSNVQNYAKDGYEALEINNNLVVEKKGEFKLNKTSYYVELGKEVSLDFTANDTAKKYFVATSGDSKVATVSKDGKITALGVGKTSISAGYADMLEDVEVVVYEVKKDEATKEETTINSVIEKIMSEETTEVKGVDKETATKVVEAVKEGKTIETVLEANEVESKDVPKEDVKLIEKVIEKEDKLVSYLDVNVLLKVEDDTIGKITELDNKVKVSVDVPTTLPEVEKGYTRNYYVIRVHNGETTKLDAKVVDGKIVFETDKFSTYALAYNDVKDEVIVNPNTLDSVGLYMIMGMLSLMALGVSSLYIVRKNK